MKKYRIVKHSDNCFEPQYGYKILFFTFWCSFDDIGLDGYLWPVLFFDYKYAKEFLNRQKQPKEIYEIG